MAKGNNHWEITTLGDICRRGGGFIQTGPFGSQLHASDYVEDGIPTIMPKNIGENKVNEDDLSRVAPNDVERLRKYKVQTGDIVYSRRGDVTLRALIREQQNGWLCGTGSLMIRLGKGVVDPKFVSYYLGTSNAREWIQNHAVGATMPNLNTSIMSAAPIAHPPLPEQQKIAAVLSALDAKIELNQRINAELESMAKTLYDYWFVQFDFPNEKGKPYKSAGGGMVWNEELKREIPLGWEVGKISDIVSNVKETTSAGEYLHLPYIPIDNLPMKKLISAEVSPNSEAKSSLILFKKHDILLGAMRVYFHRVCLAIRDGITRSTTFVLRPKNNYLKYYSLFTINKDESIEFAKINSKGTTMPYTFWEHGFEKLVVAIPPQKQLEEFNKFIEPILDKSATNELESQTLTELRGWLLPMLMNGQVQVQG